MQLVLIKLGQLGPGGQEVGKTQGSSCGPRSLGHARALQAPFRGLRGQTSPWPGVLSSGPRRGSLEPGPMCCPSPSSWLCPFPLLLSQLLTL